MTSTSTERTVIALQQLFAGYGLPLQLVFDNDPNVPQSIFNVPEGEYGVKCIQYSPYHPSSIWLAEQFVGTFKQAMKAGEADGTTKLLAKLQNYSTCNHQQITEFSFHYQLVQSHMDSSYNERVLQQQTNQQL